MKNVALDIDGTLTDLWPVERQVLMTLVPKSAHLDEIRERCGSVLYTIYRAAGGKPTTKMQFRRRYKTMFLKLRRQGLLPSLRPYSLAASLRAFAGVCRLVYVTGGLAAEAEYALECLALLDFLIYRHQSVEIAVGFPKQLVYRFGSYDASSVIQCW